MTAIAIPYPRTIRRGFPRLRAGIQVLWAIITTAGKQWDVDKLQDVAPLTNAKMDWTAWGTGATAEGIGNTALATEASETRIQGVLSQPSADIDRCVATITANGTKTITETGRFNQVAVGGVMLFRALFTGIPMLINDRIEFTSDQQIL